jgi:gamma-glutamylcyclotransferase (GGCT)/AIG2-like uncharacterized protein YtfP
MKHLFAYGTLMSPDRLAEITGLRPTFLPAELRGFARYQVRGQRYPGIVPEPGGGPVEGLLYFDISQSTWSPLDAYEGKIYHRKLVQVTLESGATVMAGTYVVLPEYRNLLA